MVGCHMFIMIETIYHIHIYILYRCILICIHIYIYIALRWPSVPTISPLRWPWKKSSFLTRDIPFNIPVNICSYTMRPWMPWGKVGNHGEKLWRCLKKHGENKKMVKNTETTHSLQGVLRSLSQKYTKQIAAIFLGETSRVTDAFLDLFSGLEPTHPGFHRCDMRVWIKWSFVQKFRVVESEKQPSKEIGRSREV